MKRRSSSPLRRRPVELVLAPQPRAVWKSAFDDDKRDAYATLYECLVAVVKLAAPFTPFLAEEIYQNIVRGPGGDCAESVHLCALPAGDASCIDLALSAEMAAVRNIVSLGLRVRTTHRLKVRQPLRGVEVVLSDPALRARIAPYADLIREELNVREVVFPEGDQAHVGYSAKPNFRRLGPRLGKKMKAAKQAFAALDAPALRAKLLADGFAEIELEGERLKLEPADIEVAVEAAGHFAAAGIRRRSWRWTPSSTTRCATRVFTASCCTMSRTCARS